MPPEPARPQDRCDDLQAKSGKKLPQGGPIQQSCTANPADHSSVSALQAACVSYSWCPGFAAMEYGSTHTGIVHFASGQEWQISGGRDREKSLELTPGNTASSTNCLQAPSLNTDHIPKVAELALNIQSGVFHLDAREWAAFNRTRISLTSQTNVSRVLSFQRRAYATTLRFPFTNIPQLVQSIAGRSTPSRHTAQVCPPESFSRFSPGPETMTLVFLIFTWRPLRSNVLQTLYVLLFRICWDAKVISIEKLPWSISIRDLARQGL